jgi:hypothetical protein
VNLSVWRGGKPRDVSVTVAEFKDDEATKTAADTKGEEAREQARASWAWR